MFVSFPCRESHLQIDDIPTVADNSVDTYLFVGLAQFVRLSGLPPALDVSDDFVELSDGIEFSKFPTSLLMIKQRLFPVRDFALKDELDVTLHTGRRWHVSLSWGEANVCNNTSPVVEIKFVEANGQPQAITTSTWCPKTKQILPPIVALFARQRLEAED